MGNIMDYIRWRGDLPLSKSPFNEVDNLIFSELCYMDFKDIVPSDFKSPGISLKEAVKLVEKRSDEHNDLGLLIPGDVLDMLKIMKTSLRYSNMRLYGYVNEIDTAKARQFSALTIDTCDKCVYVAYRGTDDTLAGWREDLEFACSPFVPAQKRACEYLALVSKQFPFKRLRVGGHSKGGNLAIYAAVHSGPVTKRKLTDIWSNDGPGFLDDIHKKDEYIAIADKIHSIIPKSSFVGMLLEHDDNHTVVDSSELGLMQHNGFTWQVLGNSFVTLPKIQDAALSSSLAIRKWFSEVSPDKRREFSDALYEILTSSGAKTFTDLKEANFKDYLSIIKATMNIDKEIRNGLIEFIQLLITLNARLVLDGMQHEDKILKLKNPFDKQPKQN